MQVYHGKSVFGGIAVGKIWVFSKKEHQVACVKVQDSEKELARYEAAKKEAIQQLQTLYEKACKEVGKTTAAIFEIHQMLLEDEDYTDFLKNIVTSQQVNLEYAISVTADNFSAMFAAMDDEYMKARAADVKDISERLLSVLKGSGNGAMETDTPVIVLADDLTPSETVQMDKEKILSFVTAHGSVNSHTAILAKTMGIPALVGAEMPVSEELNGKEAVVDGFSGTIYIEPDETTKEEMQEKKIREDEKKRLLQDLKGKEDVTLDGQQVMLYANIGDTSDLAMVLKNDAAGIGLFRSEFIYMESDTFPTENEQFQIYKSVAETMAGKRVIIRTLDIGADKKADYFDLGKEENPALGYRAIRICLSQPDIFKTQIRAILRAGVYGNIAVMYPMITSLEEVRQIKKIVEEVKAELGARQIAYGEVMQGIMIETPAAVMISEELAKEVDFFSIGTNDLTQYTLAIDRKNTKLDAFYNPHHPAVMKMIRMTVENAHKVGIWAGICGELGADMALTEEFLKMGVDELSVSPWQILPLRKIIREMTIR